jgi:predicted Zn-dependent peptidase
VGEPPLVTVRQALPTDYLAASFAAPGWGDPEFAAALVAMSVLDGRVFETVRTRRHLSYAPAAELDADAKVARAVLSASSADAARTLRLMLGEARRLAEETVPPRELEASRAVLLTEWLLGVRSVADQAELLAVAQLQGGDWRLARQLPDRLRTVGGDEVRAFARRYLAHFQVVLLGDPAHLPRSALGSR